MSPSTAVIGVGDVISLTATSCAGGLTWKSSDPAVASVDQDGHVRGLKAGTVSIILQSVADPTIQAAAVVAVGVVQLPNGQVNIVYINEVGPPASPANLYSVRDAIDVAATVVSGDSTLQARLIVNNGVRDTTVASSTIHPAASQGAPLHLIWDTRALTASGSRAFANGQYALRVVAAGSTGSYASAQVQVTVVNP